LPGITFRSEGQKWFVDEEWADALAGSAVAQIVLGVMECDANDAKAFFALGDLGRIVAASELESAGKSPKDLITWTHNAIRGKLDPSLVADCVAVSDVMSNGEVDFRELTISGAHCGAFDFTDTSVANVSFEHCVFDVISISERPPKKVTLTKCLIDDLDGVPAKAAVPEWIVECDVANYVFPNTNADVMNSALPERIKAGIVVLRKTFLQSGRGRKMSALVRGIRPESAPAIHAVIKELEKQGYIFVRGGDPIVHGVRARAGEVRQMLSKKPDANQGLWKALMNAK